MTKIVLRGTDNPGEWFTRVQAPNPSQKDIESMRVWLKENPEILDQISDLAKRVENKMLEENAIQREAIAFRLKDMRDELGWEQSSMLEKLLIEQVCLCWLRLYLVENSHAYIVGSRSSYAEDRYWDRRLDSAQKRFVRATTGLARVRKLLVDREAKMRKLLE